MPFSRLQHQLDVVVDVVRHQRRQPDPEVHVRPVGQLRGGPRGHLLTASSSSGLRARRLVRADRPLLDPLVRRLLRGQRHHPLHEDPGGVHVVGVQLAGLDEMLDLGDRHPAAHRGERVEVARGVAVDEVAVPVALPGPHQPEVGDDRLLQHVLTAPSKSRVSFGGEDTITLPSASYRHGRPPSATWVPPPVAVKNAAMPEPPARIRSASVPCGVSSTSSSPERYCRANSLFSPTYDATIRRSRFSASSRPSPQSSTPQLFETASRSVVPASSSASISTDGIPHNPNPPTDSVAPSGMSATASAALATTLSTKTPPAAILPRDWCARGHPRAATVPRLPSTHARPARRSDLAAAGLPGVQLHIVTGKGGTGKTTVAAALALALAAHGKTVLLCEVEGRQGIAQLFDVPPLPYEERLVARLARRPGPATSTRWRSTPSRRCWSTSRCTTGSAAPERPSTGSA